MKTRDMSVEDVRNHPSGTRAEVYSRRLFAISTVLFGSAFVAAFAHTPIGLLPDAGYDDGLFIRIGQSLAHGRWLGHFDQLTLAKGPGYPLFLAVVSWSGLPIGLAESLLFTLSLLVFSCVIARLSRSYLMATGVFVFTLWQPAFLTHRILRDAIYPSQVLLLLALAVAALYLPLSRSSRLKYAISAGLVFGWFWLTREEGFWVVPGLVVLIAASRFVDQDSRLPARSIAESCTTGVAAFALVLALFAAGNKVEYGSFALVDSREENFNAALAALQSIEAGERISYLPVPRSARMAAYDVSPAFATLRPYFDGPAGTPWQWGCGFYPQTCGDIAKGWFIWALRDAAAGHYKSPATASSFYRTIADEIGRACESRKLECRKSALPFLLDATAEQYSEAPKFVVSALKTLAQTDPDGLPLSTGTQTSRSIAARFLNNPPLTASDGTFIFTMWGWYSLRGNEWFSPSLRDNSGATAPQVFQRLPSPDLVTAFRDPHADFQRFRVIAECSPSCTFGVDGADGSHLDIRVSDLLNGARHFSVGSGALHLDGLSNDQFQIESMEGHLQWATRTWSVARRAYSLAWNPVLSLGFLAFLSSFVIAVVKRHVDVLFALALCLWTLVAARVALLVLVHTTSFPAITPLYMLPAYYLSAVASVLSIAILPRSARRLRVRSTALRDS
jgi:hypothetical protein